MPDDVDYFEAESFAPSLLAACILIKHTYKFSRSKVFTRMMRMELSETCMPWQQAVDACLPGEDDAQFGFWHRESKSFIQHCIDGIGKRLALLQQLLHFACSALLV